MDVLRLTWLGHSTVLVDLDGVRLLTDPLLRARIGPLRRIAGAAPAGASGDLDAVLVSHVHYDHLDLRSFDRLDRSVHVVMPTGGGRLLRKRGFGTVSELEAGDEIRVGAVGVRATHAEHARGRRPFDAAAPALGYLLSGSARVYFAGDTDLFDGMRELAPDLDVALLPIAGWGPRTPAGHLDPLRAAQALALLRPRTAVPIHWGTYRRIGLRGREALLRAPADAFARHARELAPEVEVRTLSVGESLELPLPVAAAAERTRTGA